MAAVLVNTSLSQAQFTHHTTLAQRIKRQAKMDAGLRRREFRDTTKDLCEAVITAATEFDTSDPQTLTKFHMFPRLPTELRLKIWRHAIDAPRIVDLRKVSSKPPLSTIPPPLLYDVCHESRAETIQTYDAYHSETPERVAGYEIKTRWIRFDLDIVHMKPMGDLGSDLELLSQTYARPGEAENFIRQWRRILSRTTPFRSDKWLDRPKQFDKINYLAISRDLLHHLPDDYEPFIRHFFPNLLVLIVLIDEDIDIDTKWKIWDLEYSCYEGKIHKKLHTVMNPYFVPRVDFAKKTKGPFKVVKLNIDYRMEIEFEMRKRFTKEEDDYNWYTAPRIRVLGAFIPEGVIVGECGRLPFEPIEEMERKYAGNPFKSIEGKEKKKYAGNLFKPIEDKEKNYTGDPFDDYGSD